MSRTTTNTRKKSSQTSGRTTAAVVRKVRAKDSDTRTVLPLTWIATEYEKRKRWWWFAAVLYIATALTFLMLAMGLWSNAAVIVAITIAFFVFYGSKPKTWTFTLEKETLTIGPKTYPLARYKAFTIEETLASKKEPAKSLIVLLPRNRFGVPLELYLTGDDDTDATIAEALETLLPFDEAPGYQTRERVFTRLARWLRLG